jgi:hypothetical protein
VTKITDLITELNIIPEEWCDMMISWFEKNSHLKKYGAYDIHDVSKTSFQYKNAIQSNPTPQDSVFHLMSKICTKSYDEYLKLNPAPIENICFKDYSIRVYNQNEGHFSQHIDQRAGGTVTRLFAMIMYLNDVEEGGETEFPSFNIKIKPERGKVLIFPCNYLFPHQGNIPISGPKYIATAFVNYSDIHQP